MERVSDREIADSLLMEWYLWSKPWRPALGVPRIAPYCKESLTSKQYDDPADLTYDKVYINQMKAVQFCVYALSTEMGQAIGAEMKNREVRVQVWRSSGSATYKEALDTVLPVMRRRGLFD